MSGADERGRRRNSAPTALPTGPAAEVKLITTAQAAELVGIRPATWRYYLARRRRDGKGQIPEPVEYHGATAMYDERAVLAWQANRPGRGARTDLAPGTPPAG